MAINIVTQSYAIATVSEAVRCKADNTTLDCDGVSTWLAMAVVLLVIRIHWMVRMFCEQYQVKLDQLFALWSRDICI